MYFTKRATTNENHQSDKCSADLEIVNNKEEIENTYL